MDSLLLFSFFCADAPATLYTKMKRKTTQSIIRKVKKNQPRRVRPMAPNTPELLVYPLTNARLEAIQRINPKPRDCVINAMEIIGMFNHTEAGIARAFVGDVGVPSDRILESFNITNSPNIHSWGQIPDNIAFFNQLPASTVIYVFVVWTNGDSHVMLVGKGNDGELYVIDPQRFQDVGVSGPFTNPSVYPFRQYPWNDVTSSYAIYSSYPPGEAMDTSD